MNIYQNIRAFKAGLRGGLLLILGLLLLSCSESIDFSDGIRDVPEGYLRISLAVPDPATVKTRGVEESAVNTLHLFFFNTDEDEFLQHYEVNVSNISNNQVLVPLNTKARNQRTSIYAVANLNLTDAQVSEFQELNVLKKYILEDINSESHVINLENGVPMIGNRMVNTASTVISTISLLRDVAKITTDVNAENYSLEEYQIYNFATKAYLSAAIDPEHEFYTDGNKIAEGLKVNEEKDFTEYLYPTKGMSDTGDSEGSFIVVKVKKTIDGNNFEYQYYRLNLRIGDEEKDGNLTYVDFEPNHWYKIKITKFLTDGYDSYEEAMKHPETDQYVAYKIHDHASEVLSMITDGYNELGVSPEVILSPRSLDGNGKVTGRDGKIIVKLYSPDGKNDGIDKFQIEMNGNDQWLELGSTTIHTIDDPDLDYDHDNQKGKQYEIPISIKEDKNIYEDSSWELTVKWNGMQRTVKISYQAAFLLPQVCDASLTIKNGDNSLQDFATIKNYWTFITGEGNSKEKESSSSGEANIPKLWGIKAQDMTGAKKRSNGFHLPMPYGNAYKSTPWEYEYEVDFSKMLNLPEYSSNSSITGVTFTVEGDDFFKNTLDWSYDVSSKKGKLKLKSGKTSFQYAGGNIIFTVKFDGDDTADITASLYHTGFFHYENNSQYAPANNFGYYYYEVVEMAGGYWLDRNIGASANTSFIDVGNELSEEERAAAGRQYSIIKETKSFQLADFNYEMCPPGYHIPTQTEWDALRLHNNFKTRSTTIDGTVYMSTYYETGNSKIGNIYLQKARFYYGVDAYNDQETRYSKTPNVGDAGAAYYWTITEAPAMEKEQMGNWVRALYLNGSSSTYVNASLTDHRMPIRCKAGNEGDAENAKESYISFNVHNATHAYIFNKNTKIALYSFPGKEIGSSTSAEKWQHFYTSTTQNLSDLLVLFVKIDNDGSVHVIRKAPSGATNDEGESIQFLLSKDYSESLLSEENAWEIQTGYYYDFCESAQTRSTDYITENKPTTSEDDPENPECNEEPDSSGGSGGQEEPFPEVDANGYTFTMKGYTKDDYEDEKVILTEKKYFQNYNGNIELNQWNSIDWRDVAPESILRIYTYKVDDRYNLQIFHGNWGSMLFNVTTPTDTYDPGNGKTEESIIEITLTQSLLTTIINNNNKLCLQGRCCVLLGVTLQQPHVELPSGNYLFQGRQQINWSYFAELSSSKYNWEKIQEGATLTIEFDYNDSNNCQVYIRNGKEGEISDIPGTIANWSNPQYMSTKSFSCKLTQTQIDQIKNNGGLIIGGGVYFLTKLELKVD